MRVLAFGVGAIGSLMVHAKEDPLGGRMKADYKNWVLKKGGCFAIPSLGYVSLSSDFPVGNP